MSNHSPLQPANGTANAADIVQRVQLVDSSGNVQATTGGAVDTELPAAVALGDTDANPTTPTVGAAGMIWDNTNSVWKRFRSVIGLTDAILGTTLAPVDTWLYNGATYDRARTVVGVGDANAGTGAAATGVYVFNGATWDRQRTSVVFKSFASTAITAGVGMTAWTPAGGKKFRLMGFAISSSVAGVLIFGDNAVGTVIARSPAVAAAGIAQLGSSDMGNGILSAAANNVLKLDGPTGNVAGMVWGTEE